MIRRYHTLGLGLILAVGLGTAACGDATGPEGEEDVQEQSLAINYTVPQLGDIEKVKFKVIKLDEECLQTTPKKPVKDCIEKKFKRWGDVKLTGYPKKYDSFFKKTDAKTKLDQNSSHYAVDKHLPVPAGKYMVKAIPKKKKSDSSGYERAEHCNVAKVGHKHKHIEVVGGKMTHVELISQCKGKEIGGINNILAFNRPPAMKVDYKDSNKIGCEGRAVKVCAKAWDKDRDPMKMVWEQKVRVKKPDGSYAYEYQPIAKGGERLSSSPIKKIVQKKDRGKKKSTLKECILYQPKGEKRYSKKLGKKKYVQHGTKKFRVTSYDLTKRFKDGKRKKIEDILHKYSQKNETSQASYKFPIEGHACKGKVITMVADLSNHNDNKYTSAAQGLFDAEDFHEESFPELEKFLKRTIEHAASKQPKLLKKKALKDIPILVVLNEGNQGEFVRKSGENYIFNRLKAAGFTNVDFHDEENPVDGPITYDKMAKYNIVWMHNPGYLLNLSVAKYNALHYYATNKKGSLILQGDDITQVTIDDPDVRDEMMTETLQALTGLEFLAHGVTCDGFLTDNNQKHFYEIRPDASPFRAYLRDDLGQTPPRRLFYGNDIDRNQILDPTRTDRWARTSERIFKREGMSDYTQVGTCSLARNNPVIVEHNLWPFSKKK